MAAPFIHTYSKNIERRKSCTICSILKRANPQTHPVGCTKRNKKVKKREKKVLTREETSDRIRYTNARRGSGARVCEKGISQKQKFKNAGKTLKKDEKKC